MQAPPCLTLSVTPHTHPHNRYISSGSPRRWIQGSLLDRWAVGAEGGQMDMLGEEKVVDGESQALS